MPLFLFFDEAGNFDFSPNGSKYCLFGVLSTFDPTGLNEVLTQLRYEMLVEGTALERLHAAEDRQAVRDRVFTALRTIGGFEFDVVVVEKRKTHPDLSKPASFYPHFGVLLLEGVFRRHHDLTDPVVLITDTIPLKKHRRAIEKAFKQYIRRHLEGQRFSVHHHASAAHPALQAADYCTWAIYRKWQRGDVRSYRLVEPFLKAEIDVLAGERSVYY